MDCDQGFVGQTYHERLTIRSDLRHLVAVQPSSSYQNPNIIPRMVLATISEREEQWLREKQTHQRSLRVLPQLILLRPLWDILPRFERPRLSTSRKIRVGSLVYEDELTPEI